MERSTTSPGPLKHASTTALNSVSLNTIQNNNNTTNNNGTTITPNNNNNNNSTNQTSTVPPSRPTRPSRGKSEGTMVTVVTSKRMTSREVLNLSPK
jgi:hypothetical protein